LTAAADRPTVAGMPGTPSQNARVVALLNAISNLRKGDLLAVLSLDAQAPGIEWGPDDVLSLSDDGKGVIVTPGARPPPRSLANRMTTGEKLGRFLEQQLTQTMAYGEATRTVYYKDCLNKDELGNFEFNAR
jgi:hypothetical protein